MAKKHRRIKQVDASHICSLCHAHWKIASSCSYWGESGNYHARTAQVSTTAGRKQMKILFKSINSELLKIFLPVTSDRHQYFYLSLPKITWNWQVDGQHFNPCSSTDIQLCKLCNICKLKIMMMSYTKPNIVISACWLRANQVIPSSAESWNWVQKVEIKLHLYQ